MKYSGKYSWFLFKKKWIRVLIIVLLAIISLVGLPQGFLAKETDSSSTSIQNGTVNKTDDETITSTQQTQHSPSVAPMALSDWTVEDPTAQVIKLTAYNGDPTTIIVPSEINGKPVEIDLGTVLGTYLQTVTEHFTIESSQNGLASVKINGSLDWLFMNFNDPSPIQTINFSDADISSISSMMFTFGHCENLIDLDLTGLDTSSITNMVGTFSDCKNLPRLDLTNWDTSTVNNMSTMFAGCESLTNIPIEGFDTARVQSMSGMFSSCTSIENLNLSHLDFSNVTDIESMFYGCSALKELDLTRLDTTNISCSDGMFEECSSLESLTISSTFEMVESDYSTQPFTGHGLRQLPLPANNNKTNSYWIKDDDLTNPIASTSDLITTHNALQDGLAHTYTLQRTHEVDFNITGGSGTAPSSQHIFENQVPSEPTYTGTKEYQNFDGWRLNGAAYDFSSPVTEPITLAAAWSDYTYTVRFHSNGGGGSMADQTAAYPTATSLTQNTFTRPGYTFAGWNTQADGKGADFSDGQSVQRLVEDDGGIYSLYAKWTPITYTITFDDPAIQPLTYTVEDQMTLPALSKTGYQFSGWLITERSGTEPTKDIGEIVTVIPVGTRGNLKLAAQWQANRYTVAFDANQGEGSMTNLELAYDQQAKLPANAFTRAGYTFAGWNTKKDGSGIWYTNEQDVKNLIAENGGQVILYAQWNADKSTLQDLVTKENNNNRQSRNYTTASWTAYEKAFQQAVAVLADPLATPKQINEAYLQLQQAIDGLTPVEQGAIHTVVRKVYPITTTVGTGKNLPKTGAVAGSGLMLLGFASVGASILGWKKKKRK